MFLKYRRCWQKRLLQWDSSLGNCSQLLFPREVRTFLSEVNRCGNKFCKFHENVTYIMGMVSATYSGAFLISCLWFQGLQLRTAQLWGRKMSRWTGEKWGESFPADLIEKLLLTRWNVGDVQFSASFYYGNVNSLRSFFIPFYCFQLDSVLAWNEMTNISRAA